jgi:hypothetical protein
VPTLDDVSSIAADLPGNVTKVTPYGSTWLVRNKAYAWESHPWPSEAEHIRELVSRELCIGVKVPDDDTKRALVQGWPDAFAVSETSWGGPKVIVRMQHVDEQLLRELVIDAWRTEAPKYLVREYDEREHAEQEGAHGDVG